MEEEHREDIETSEKQKMTTRGRIVKPPRWHSDFEMQNRAKSAYKEDERTQDPSNVYEALQSKENEEWRLSMIEELDNFLRNEVWEFTKRRPQAKTLQTKWAFKRKFNGNRKLARYRSRLVAMGNQQKPGIDYNLTYSPVVKTKTMRLLFAVAQEEEWEVDHVDVVAAYLTAPLEEEVYIEVPQGFIRLSHALRDKFKNVPKEKELSEGMYIIKIKKCMYGLHQSGRIWNERIDKVLKNAGMQRCVADPCVYFHPGKPIIITVYVDDLLFFGKRREIDEAKKMLSEKMEVRDLGIVSCVQSIRVTYVRDEIHLDQAIYAEEILKEF